MIHIKGIGKRYHLGGGERHDTLRDMVIHRARALAGRGKADEDAAASGEFWALRDVTFDIKEGEVVGIIGRNGAGKSTLLKILSRIMPPTEGRIRLKGRVASLLEVGTGFHPELTGRENIFMNGAILGMRRTELRSKFDEIVAFSEVEKFIDTPVKRYSSGMRVRLAFAVAAHLEPEILIVDEVLAVGDAAFQQKCLGKMGEVARGGRTVLFVSHNMSTVEQLCSRAILFRDGRVHMDAGVSDTIATYYEDIQTHLEPGLAYGVNRELLDAEAEGFRITDIQLRSLSGNPLKECRTGDGIVVRILYQAKSELVSPVFRVQIKSGMGLEVFRVNTRPISGYTIERLGKEGYIDLQIESLPLTSGEYLFNVGLARERQAWVVRLEDVVVLAVGPRDVYGSGMPVDSGRGMIVLPHRWDHHPK